LSRGVRIHIVRGNRRVGAKPGTRFVIKDGVDNLGS